MSRKLFLNIVLAFMLLPVNLVKAQPALPQANPSAQQGKPRDLVYETDAAAAARQGNATIPRSYALVIAVAKYKNLRDDQQLQFSERDADSIYSSLISPEGGNFPAQNVEKLIGPNATLANIRSKLEQWLPSVAGEDDRVLVYFAGHGFVAGSKACYR